MKFSVTNALAGFSFISMVMASPFPSAQDSHIGNGFEAPVAVASSDHTLRKVDTLPRELDTAEPSDILATRGDRLVSKFKVHVVTSSAKVIGIIIIDYIINKLVLPGADESITADFDKLTNVKVKGPLVATHFDNPPTLLGHPQQAVFDFSTSVVSGVFDLGLDAAGMVQSVVRSTGVHLGPHVVAKTLHFFNEKNLKIGTIRL
ncbi:predicted protein [Verticillium alfalfae VaMs.102]|uniref:Predicted protein n=1 Tax=Verticillium alfalfae (strain VaMs.102 / ATCC MYA-4576 / FGSC 10136) TaxID=526221 RepID=C9SD16_VERA1|nr:predicted protein [Verticillium alfalfae VaMs.102]EEY16981.1 predicted protein [Verticillium alfalfae VaMs.102]